MVWALSPRRISPPQAVGLTLALAPLLAPLLPPLLAPLPGVGQASALSRVLAPIPPAASAEPEPLSTDPQVEALVRTAEEACRGALARRFNTAAASVEVWLTPGLRISLEGGAAGLAELRRSGMEFGWMLPQRPAPAPIGLCRTGGDGRVQAIEQQPD